MTMTVTGIRIAFGIVLFCAMLVSAGENNHRYQNEEPITLWANKVGPYHNPQETYSLYSLPFCRPSKKHAHKDSLGSLLLGNDLVDSDIKFEFRNAVQKSVVCDVDLTEDTATVLYHAIKNQFWYQYYLDDLPIWGMVGEIKEDQSAVVFTHQSYSISYNGDRIIEVNLTTDKRVPVAPGTKLTFTYSVEWQETEKSFDNRFERYLDSGFFEHQIHFFAVFNSMMMLIFLVGLVFIIFMRTVRNDISKYAREEDELDLERLVDETGWKQIHGDVFRTPRRIEYLAALVGTGSQLAVLLFLVIALAIIRSLYIWRGAILSSFVVFYALTSFVAGYSSARYYKLHGQKAWKFTFLLTACGFPAMVTAVGMILNTVAIFYSSTASVPFTTILGILFLWLLVSCPLNFAGTWYARKTVRKKDFPCRVMKVTRPIPRSVIYTRPLFVILAGGVLPFGSIFIELYFIFTAFWNYKFYYVFEFMLFVLIILVIVTACVCIICTYFMLNAENHRWPWTSFMTGASTGFYAFLYGIYYFYTKTHMTGFFQTLFFYGYLSVICGGLGTMCGAVGFLSSQVFVRMIYRNIKSD